MLELNIKDMPVEHSVVKMELQYYYGCPLLVVFVLVD